MEDADGRFLEELVLRPAKDGRTYEVDEATYRKLVTPGYLASTGLFQYLSQTRAWRQRRACPSLKRLKRPKNL